MGVNFFQPVTPLDVWAGKLVFTLTTAGMILASVGMYPLMRKRAWM